MFWIAIIFQTVFFQFFLHSGHTELVFLSILYRHGDRSPTGTFPKDPIKEMAWPQGFGQLTKRGMIQHYELGQFLRRRYIEGNPYMLLNESYSRYEIEINSTDYDRTLMSAYSNLAGLYPPLPGQAINESTLKWQPIPVHTKPVENDHMLHMDTPCAKYTHYFEQELHSEEIQKEERENKEFYEFVSNMTGFPHETLNQIWKAFDPLFCEMTHNMTLPAWVNRTFGNQTVLQKLKQLTSLEFDTQFNHPVLRRLRGGPLLGEIIRNMKAKIAGTLPFNQRKCYVYSAHDDTVSALLSAMQVFNRIAPPYTATVLVELHKNDSVYSVKVLYRNETTVEPHVLMLPGCMTEMCPLDEFVITTVNDVPVDWQAECNNDSFAVLTNYFYFIVIGVIAGVLLLVIIISVVLVVVCRRRRHVYDRYVGLNTDMDQST